MGLFGHKDGGTFMGNLLRKVSNKATGGLLGNGEHLAKMTKDPVLAQKALADNALATSATLNDTIAGLNNGQPLDLNKIVTLPTVNMGTDTSTKSTVLIGFAALALIILFTSKRKH